MTIDYKIRDENYNTTILPSGPSQIIQQAKFTNSSLGKAFEKQTEK